MRLLILGGTQFVGRALVEAALADGAGGGHQVSIFNRGTTQPTGKELFGDRVEHLAGDRRSPGGLAALETGEWDAVVDCAGYLASEVAASVAALKGRVRFYVFVSSVSAYTGVAGDGDEAAAANYAAAGLPRPPSPEEMIAEDGLDGGTPTAVFAGGEVAALAAT
eukprot:SAG22_NODE_7238_length_758_cov_1.550835_1_plen_164_part_10